MKRIVVDLNKITDTAFEYVYDLFGLGVINKSLEDFESRMVQIHYDVIVEIRNREENREKCFGWIYTFESIQQKNAHFYCVWG